MNELDDLYRHFKNSSGVTIDSRSVVEGSLFFALSGDNFDGNRFASEALRKGAKIAVVDKKEYATGQGFFLVNNTLKALQQLAERHLHSLKIPVVAITGTNGKTTTKELVSAVLSTEKNIHSTQGNFNNHIGVPLTILGIDEKTELAVVEMGANHPGEIKTLCNIAHPEYGIITNIGKAHLEGFGNLQGVIDTKKELYDAIAQKNGMVFVHRNNHLLMELSKRLNRFTYGVQDAEVVGTLLEKNPFLRLIWQYENKAHTIDSQLYGSYNFYNIMAAVAVGVYFKIAPQHIKEAIEEYVPINNRSQFVETDKNRIVLDAYNANPESMRLAIEDFIHSGFAHPVVILGDMFELGNFGAEEHQQIVNLLTKAALKNIILVGSLFCQTKVPTTFNCYKTTAEACKAIEKEEIKNSTILIKGSRGMQMEQLANFL